MKKGFISKIFCINFFLASLHATQESGDAQKNTDAIQNISAKVEPYSSGFTFFSDLLFWTAKEAGADCWAEAFQFNGSTSSDNIREVSFGWDPGFRAGVGYGMNHDQWDTQGYYTWFYTRGKDSVSGDLGTVHSSFLGNFYVNNPMGAGITGPAYEKASIDWTIHFNIFDWELGRNYHVSKSVYLRPFLGIKGGWINQTIHSKWENPNLSGSAYFDIGTEDLTNDFWGIGPSGGINTKWNVFEGANEVYLFGDFSGAIMWGHWSFSDLFQNNLPEEVNVGLQKLNSGATMIRSFMGLGWNTVFSQNKYRFSAKLGYEMQFWLDQLQFYSFTGGRLVNQLTLQGGSLEFRFDF